MAAMNTHDLPSTYPSFQHPNTIISTSSNLQQPIAIPATAANLGSPFLRAYPIELETHNISPSDFLSFLDELNRLVVVSPPVRVLGLAGDIVGMVPLATAQIVGGAVKAASILTSHGMSKARSELFIKEANKTLFAPRGLRVDIVKLGVVAKVANIPILDASGKVSKDARLLAPVEVHDNTMSAQQRRLVALARYTSPLEILPDEHQAVPSNIFDKMHASASERQRSSEESKALKKRSKVHGANQKDILKARREYDKAMEKIAQDEEKVRKKEKNKPEKMARELSKLEKEREKMERKLGEEMEKGGGENGKKDKEEQALRKILWLLIQRNEQMWESL
jgi:hypothetical protein